MQQNDAQPHTDGYTTNGIVHQCDHISCKRRNTHFGEADPHLHTDPNLPADEYRRAQPHSDCVAHADAQPHTHIDIHTCSLRHAGRGESPPPQWRVYFRN